MTPEQIAALASLAWMLKDAGAIGGLVYLVWLILSDRVVTRKHMDEVVRAIEAGREVQTAEAKAREAEWKRLATRGTDEIIVPLASAVRELGAQQGTQQEAR